MIHGPCGKLNEFTQGRECMAKFDLETNKCEKKYPHDFIDETSITEDGYPKYKRTSPENGGESYENIVKKRVTNPITKKQKTETRNAHKNKHKRYKKRTKSGNDRRNQEENRCAVIL